MCKIYRVAVSRAAKLDMFRDGSPKMMLVQMGQQELEGSKVQGSELFDARTVFVRIEYMNQNRPHLTISVGFEFVQFEYVFVQLEFVNLTGFRLP